MRPACRPCNVATLIIWYAIITSVPCPPAAHTRSSYSDATHTVAWRSTVRWRTNVSTISPHDSCNATTLVVDVLATAVVPGVVCEDGALWNWKQQRGWYIVQIWIYPRGCWVFMSNVCSIRAPRDWIYVANSLIHACCTCTCQLSHVPNTVVDVWASCRTVDWVVAKCWNWVG
jgi:hypothetical protein